MSITMTKRQKLWGLIFLFIHPTLLPMLLLEINEHLPHKLSVAELNFSLFFISFVITVLLFRKFLWENIKLTAGSLWRTLRWAGAGFLIYYASITALTLLFGRLFPDYINANDASITTMLRQRYVLVSVGLILLIPITEETLYRGLIFGSLRSRSRVLAYIVSTLAFSVLHLLGYIGTLPPLSLLLSFVQYLPAGFALALAYDRSGSIWSSILIHMAVNQIGILSTR